MMDLGLLREIAASRDTKDVGIRDMAIHPGMSSFRFYVRQKGPACPTTITDFAKDLGWKDEGGRFKSKFEAAVDRLGRLGVHVKDTQIGWSVKEGWMARMKLLTSLEHDQYKTAPELMRLWRAYGAPVELASQLAQDAAFIDLEHLGPIFEGNDAFTSGECYANPINQYVDSVSIERFSKDPMRPVYSRYAAWRQSLNAASLSRHVGVPRRQAEVFLETLGDESFAAVSVIKKDSDGQRLRGVSIELSRLEGEGIHF